MHEKGNPSFGVQLAVSQLTSFNLQPDATGESENTCLD
jgi:hypothetical protein